MIKKIKDYFEILEPNFPKWLNKYINTKAMLHQKYISITCGTIYSKLFESKFFYLTLDHSVAVALIVWHFTHDKKQTLAGLFHDIATPILKHYIDFFNGDYQKQESTEDLTTSIIENSNEIMSLLEKDNIKIQEISNYHLYPIADNDTPKLSADRLEYSLSNALFTYELVNIDKIKEIYDNIEIQTNEENEIELGFKTKKIARDFVRITSKLSIIYREDRTRYSMQFLADIIKKLIKENVISVKQLYVLKESDIINTIQNSKYNEIFNIWKNAKKVKVSSIKPQNVYFVKVNAKVRFINPLYKGNRISNCCNISKRMIDKNLSYKMDNYVYLDFKFEQE